MSEAPEPGKSALASGPSREEFGSATDVMSALVKTTKGLRIYPPNSPTLINFVEELNGKMSAHMVLFGDFKLQVDPFALRYRGAEIYQNLDPKESMAFRMHSDGIRVLLFSSGLSERELTEFLEIVGFEPLSHTDDDIVTRLWACTLPHIAYLLEEDLVDLESPETGGAAVASQQGALTRILSALASNPPAPPRTDPKSSYMLTAEEAIWLRNAVNADARRNPLDDVINILSAILAGVQDPEQFRDFCDIVGKLAVDLFLAAEVGHALRLVRFLNQLQSLGSMSADRRGLIAQKLAGLLGDAVLQALLKAIDDGESVSQEDLGELLRILGLPSIGSICELLGRVEKLKMRKVVVEVLIELGRGNAAVFAPFLSDPRWYLVRNIVLVLSLLETPAALAMIVGVISHREPRVRKEVLGFLEKSADPKAKPYLLKFLRDDSRALRIRALQILGKDRPPFALKPVLALTSGEEFKARDLAEKKVVYETLGELGSEQMVPLFRDMLLKKQWFRRTTPRESVVCAVAGLQKVRHVSALEVLKEARQQGTPEIRAIIGQADKAATTDSGKTAA